MTKKLATCTLCEAGCGIVVDVEGDRVVSVRGDSDDPMSRGYVCPKVVGMQDLGEDPNRIRRPLVRDGKEFREVSWDEAFTRAADGLRRVRKEHGNDALGVYQGNPTAHNLGLLTVGQAVFRTLGTKNLFSASSADQVPHMRAAHEMFGHLVLMPVPDIDRTDFWLILGANPAVSNGSIMTAPDVRSRIAKIRARGGKVVVVDPRRTETADLADTHVFLRPGADPLFLFSMLHVMFEERLTKEGTAPLSGMDKLGELAKRFSPERVADATGISASDLRTLARDFAGARRAVCYPRVGTCHQEHATPASWLAYALSAVTGNMDREGGLMWTKPAADIAWWAEQLGVGGIGRWKSRVRGLAETAGELPCAVMAEEMETPGDGQIRALITSAGNPVLSTPNGVRLETALAKLDHMVSIDSYLNETTRHAHVILPPCAPLQRDHYDLALNAFAVRNTAKWVDAPVPRGPHDKDDAEIILELAARLRLPLSRTLGAASLLGRARAPERTVDLLLRTGPYGFGRGGLSVAELRKHPHGMDLGPLTPQLPALLCTKDKRVHLAPPALVAEVDEIEKLLAAPRPELVLIGRRHLRSNNSWMHNSQRLVKGPRRCTLLLHPDDAKKRGLSAGDTARLTSARGEVDAFVEVTDEIMPGVVSLPHGWGHHRAGTRMDVAEAHAGVSMNDVTDEHRLDRMTGNAALSGVPVGVTRRE